jgi:hypothetical protein
MNSLLKKIELTETTELNKHYDTELGGLGRSHRFAVPQERS